MTVRVTVLGLAFLVAGLHVATAQSDAASTSTRPPKNLKKVGDHWTPWDPPQPAEGAYVIQRGDTFWDLSGQWLGDPHLWPQVWDQNRYVLDSHWIYPGDPLNVPAKPTVVPPEGPPPSAAATDAEEPPAADPGAAIAEDTAPPAEAPARTTPAMIQVADERDLYCSGWIDEEREQSLLRVEGAELEKIMQGTGDIVYLNQGRTQGIEAGAEYLVVRPDHNVVHPATKEAVGTFTQRMGHVRVLCAQENTATAVIVSACEDIRPGDELLPWKEMQSPMMDRVPAADRCTEPSGLAQGWVIDGGPDALLSVGVGHLLSTDLGPEDGIRPGSLLTIYRDNGDLPRIVLAQAVVLTVESSTSTAKVVQSRVEIRRGDRAEVFQQ
jgi:nucleoid-associated protein YgaU